MANPMLLPLVIILGVVLWFILSFTFHAVGRFFTWIGKRTAESLDMVDDQEDEEDDQNSEESLEENENV